MQIRMVYSHLCCKWVLEYHEEYINMTYIEFASILMKLSQEIDVEFDVKINVNEVIYE